MYLFRYIQAHIDIPRAARTSLFTHEIHRSLSFLRLKYLEPVDVSKRFFQGGDLAFSPTSWQSIRKDDGDDDDEE